MKIGLIVWSILIIFVATAVLGWGMLFCLIAAAGVACQTLNSPKI